MSKDKSNNHIVCKPGEKTNEHIENNSHYGKCHENTKQAERGGE